MTRDKCEAWEWWYAHKTENLHLPAPISLYNSNPLLHLPPAHANLNHHPPATAVHSFLLLSDFTKCRTRGAHIYANKHDHTGARHCLSHTPPLAIFHTHSSPPTLSLFLCFFLSVLHLPAVLLAAQLPSPSFFPTSGLVVWTEVSLHVRRPPPLLQNRQRYSVTRVVFLTRCDISTSCDLRVLKARHSCGRDSRGVKRHRLLRVSGWCAH